MATLNVNPDHLTNLAANQLQAETYIQSAQGKPKGIAGTLQWEHGPVCTETINHMKNLMDARKKACDLTQTVSTDLAAKLTAASDAYAASDAQNANTLNQQMLAQ